MCTQVILTMTNPMVLFGVLCISVALLSPTLRRFFRNRRLALRHGCKNPPSVDSIDFSDLGGKASQEHRYLDVTGDLFIKHGTTHTITNSGKRMIRTCDPEISKAVLATQFEKFGLQPIRYENAKVSLSHDTTLSAS